MGSSFRPGNLDICPKKSAFHALPAFQQTYKEKNSLFEAIKTFPWTLSISRAGGEWD
jgi:hypothetical protein